MNCYATAYNNGKREVWNVTIKRELSPNVYLDIYGYVWDGFQLFKTEDSAWKWWNHEYVALDEYWKI